MADAAVNSSKTSETFVETVNMNESKDAVCLLGFKPLRVNLPKGYMPIDVVIASLMDVKFPHKNYKIVITNVKKGSIIVGGIVPIGLNCIVAEGALEELDKYIGSNSSRLTHGMTNQTVQIENPDGSLKNAAFAYFGICPVLYIGPDGKIQTKHGQQWKS